MTDFSPRALRLVNAFCQDEARKSGSEFIQPEHILLALIKKSDGLGVELLKILKLSLPSFQLALEQDILSKASGLADTDILSEIPRGRRVDAMLDLASIESQALENKYVGTEHIVLACVRESDSVAAVFFEKSGVSLSDARAAVRSVQKNNMSSYLVKRAEALANVELQNIFGAGKGVGRFDSLFAGAGNNPQSSRDAPEKKSFLSEYSRDITRLFREGKADPVVGREKEIQRLIQILSRRTKNNPVLVGEPGIGKTAIVEGLAQAVAKGAVPSGLLKKRILSLDLTSLVAGTKYRGEFEERMKKMMKEVKDSKDIILFIDELHTIIGAGGPEGQMDASNMLKPALSRGELQLIGATTTKEYSRYIEKDSALARRFQKVDVEEPTDEDSVKILEGIKAQYEHFHGVVYDDDVIPAIVRLSRRYIPERFLPDKAIDILDEAGAQKKIQEENKPSELNDLEVQINSLIEEKKHLVQQQDYENAAYVRDKVLELKRKFEVFSNYWKENGIASKRHVTADDIAHIVGEMTGIPVEQLGSSESSRLVKMEDEMHRMVIGQDEAVRTISGAVRRSRAGISSPKHPIGSFIFLGPTGVGKTQLAKALAKFMFGSDSQLIRIDMSDFMEKHNASRLVGAPPGYVGYEDGGVLTEQVRRHPYSVILLDEIEKAHPDVFNLLLQILEEGELHDNLGHTVNFRNTVIIMTSNAGARQITAEGRVGFSASGDGVLSYAEIKSGAMAELKKLLSPELLNRIDDVIVFNALSKAEVSKILDIQIAELSARLKDRNLSVTVRKSAREYLIEKGYEPSMGARPMRRLIQREIEEPLSLEILDERNAGLSEIAVECRNNALRVHFVRDSKKISGRTTIRCVSNKPDSSNESVLTTVNILEDKK